MHFYTISGKWRVLFEEDAELISPNITNKDFAAGLEAAYARRERVFRAVCTCPKCGSRQIQALNWMRLLCKWRCRECSHKFTYEPLTLR